MDYEGIRRKLEKDILDGGGLWIDEPSGGLIRLDLHLTAHRVTRGQTSLIGEPLDLAATLSTYEEQILNKITQRREQRRRIAQQLGGVSYTAAEGIIYAGHDGDTSIDAPQRTQNEEHRPTE